MKDDIGDIKKSLSSAVTRSLEILGDVAKEKSREHTNPVSDEDYDLLLQKLKKRKITKEELEKLEVGIIERIKDTSWDDAMKTIVIGGLAIATGILEELGIPEEERE